jgi:hypothetical protein
MTYTLTKRRLMVYTAAFIGVILTGSTPVAGQNAGQQAGKAAPAARQWEQSRTPDGQPDLQGIWSNITGVPLERPKELGAKEFYTPQEMAENAARAARKAPVDKAGTRADVHYDFSQFALDSNHTRVAPNLRTSLIVGPEGRIPPVLPEAQKRAADRAERNRGHQFDGPENRGLSERCIVWPNEAPPMIAGGYNGNVEIVQGHGYVAILQEMIHSTRMVPTNGSPHLPANIHQWLGDSRGHWEGNTLVVDTTNFTDQTAFRGSADRLHVVERFTRTGEDSLMYEFTVSDPTTWEKSWTAQIPWARSDAPIFEYACQEGNYGMANILSQSRAEEKEAAEAAAKKDSR